MLKHFHNNQQMWEILWSTVYLLGNIYVGSGKYGNMKDHVDDVQMRQTDLSQWMTSQKSHAK